MFLAQNKFLQDREEKCEKTSECEMSRIFLSLSVLLSLGQNPFYETLVLLRKREVILRAYPFCCWLPVSRSLPSCAIDMQLTDQRKDGDGLVLGGGAAGSV